MTHFDVIRLIVLTLALIGYLFLMARLPWVTAALTGLFGLYVMQFYPLRGAYLPYWIAAAFVLLGLFARLHLTGAKRSCAPSTDLQTPKSARGIVVDGANVMYWDGDAALSTLRSVVADLKRRGYAPIVFLDASSRHHLGDRSLDEKAFARALDLPQGDVTVCPAQTQADGFILKYARAEGLPVLSNDRFRDRATQVKGLKLVKGVITKGRPVFEGL